MSLFTKQPAEQYRIAVEFAGKLPTGLSLVSGAVSAIRLDTGADQSATVLGSTIATIIGTQASVLIKAGAGGVQYKITLSVVLSDADASILEEDIVMSVMEK